MQNITELICLYKELVGSKQNEERSHQVSHSVQPPMINVAWRGGRKSMPISQQHILPHRKLRSPGACLGLRRCGKCNVEHRVPLDKPTTKPTNATKLLR